MTENKVTFRHNGKTVLINQSCNYECYDECGISVWNRCPRNIARVQANCESCDIYNRCIINPKAIDNRKMCFIERADEQNRAEQKSDKEIIWNHELEMTVLERARCPYTAEFQNRIAYGIAQEELFLAVHSEMPNEEEMLNKMSFDPEYQRHAKEYIQNKYPKLEKSDDMCAGCAGYCQLDSHVNMGQMIKRKLLTGNQKEI